MDKDISIGIVSSDPFARNWMALLLARDWRTRVMAEVDRPGRLGAVLKDINSHLDMVVMDLDRLNKEDEVEKLWQTLSAAGERHPMVVFVGSQIQRENLPRLMKPDCRGILLKDEIGYSLGWALALAKENHWVMTPALEMPVFANRSLLSRPCLLLDGRRTTSSLTEQETRAARLAFLFSMERRELADELKIGEDWTYGLVSKIYEKLGLKDLLSDGSDPREYLGDNPLVLSYFDKIKKSFHGTGKARDMETLAFHLLTMPEIREAR